MAWMPRAEYLAYRTRQLELANERYQIAPKPNGLTYTRGSHKRKGSWGGARDRYIPMTMVERGSREFEICDLAPLELDRWVRRHLPDALASLGHIMPAKKLAEILAVTPEPDTVRAVMGSLSRLAADYPKNAMHIGGGWMWKPGETDDLFTVYPE